MKKAIFILVVLSMILPSCNKKKGTDKDPNSDSQLIIGKWKFDEVYNNYNWSESIDHYWTLEFTSNKVFQRDEDSNLFELYYNIFDNIIYMGQNEQINPIAMKYKIKDVTPYELFIFREDMQGQVILDTINYKLIR